MTIGDLMARMAEQEGPSSKDFMTFLSTHARGNVVQLGLCERACGVIALLYGVERNGGHVWTVNPFCADCMSAEPFVGHPQWSLIESDPLDVIFARTGGVPEEVDLLFINSASDQLDTTLVLKSWGHTVKTTGLIVVAGVKKFPGTKTACEDYAKGYGMMFRARPESSDLGVIFYQDNKEALKS